MRHLILPVAAIALAATPQPAAAQFSDGYNFLKAVRDRDVLKARSFIEKPGSIVVNTRDADTGETALIIAIKRRDPPWMGFLLQNGADPNARDRDGNTPLIIAAMSNFPDGVRLMLAAKAQVDLPNPRGETALIKAIHNRDLATAQLLLNAGADPDRPDNLTGRSAREYAERDIRGGPLAKLMAEAPKRTAARAVGPQF
jgi:ankyrin repeat protein